MILCAGHPTGELPFWNAFDLGLVGTGGISFSDTAPVENTIDIIGSGGITFSDTAPVENTVDIDGTGGITLSGTAGLGDYKITTETES